MLVVVFGLALVGFCWWLLCFVRFGGCFDVFVCLRLVFDCEDCLLFKCLLLFCCLRYLICLVDMVDLSL